MSTLVSVFLFNEQYTSSKTLEAWSFGYYSKTLMEGLPTVVAALVLESSFLYCTKVIPFKAHVFQFLKVLLRFHGFHLGSCAKNVILLVFLPEGEGRQSSPSREQYREMDWPCTPFRDCDTLCCRQQT